MSLQIWLPLNKDLRNLGTKHSTVTSTNATLNTNGKLGGCYSFNGSSSYLLGTQDFISNSIGDWSFACWMKINTTSAACLFSCRTTSDSRGITIFYYGSQWLIDDGVRWTLTPTVTITTNTWYHICVVRKKGVGKYLYVNGVLDSSTTATGTPSIISTTNYSIGGSQGTAASVTGNYLNGYLNDVRFYNNALSVAEIKELSKGLVCHYKLNDRYVQDNLIINGYGELGTENWNYTSSSYISTTVIPSDHPEIKASFYNGNNTKEYIPISPNHSYTISGYVKAMPNVTATSVNPSIIVYDKDKLEIKAYMTPDGFGSSYKTTLAQPLHKGDTVIYATNLSNWNTGTSNYYYFVAIFGYKNSYGDIYPDMVYTRDVPAFGTYSDKSNIDKTNNTITLLAPYAGEDRPAGTTIVQSTAGAVYYYPWGGIAVSSISDWVFAAATFKPSNVNRLKAAAYIRWSTYSGCYIAGSKLVDNSNGDIPIADCSGHGYSATKMGNMTVSSDTPRYSLSTKFASGSHIYTTLVTGGFANTYSFSWWAKYTNYSSHMMWGFSNGNRLNLYMTSSIFCWNTGDGGSNTFNVSAATYGDNNWHHFVVTGDGTTAKLYIDGEFKANAKTYKGITGTTIYMNGWDSGSSYNFNGQLSDFRLYATCLSADDVTRLYNTAASVAKNGSMLGYEIKEG